ncbi:hypothetical protein RhiirA1_418251 [Rhizophagus irregularis]|uniref:Uncharacterized protein n=1 Tax=Rhizophagus irregularis TaxID=588596 RepID=A0A2N0RVP4_9GLOM|nr:hypothetical protein RhiirA1_418251 [Rhizophagus irregularis]
MNQLDGGNLMIKNYLHRNIKIMMVLLISVAVNDKASYSTLIAHGFVMDVLAILEKSSKSRD